MSFLCGFDLLSAEYRSMRIRAQASEDQCAEVSDLLVAALLQKDPGAREWLEQIARLHQDDPQHPAARMQQHRAALRDVIGLIQLLMAAETTGPETRYQIAINLRLRAAAQLVGVDLAHFEAHRTPVLLEEAS